MRRGRPGTVAMAVIFAAGVAAAGAAANLHLLEPQRRSREPVVLGITVERPSTTTTTAPPPTALAIITTTTTGEQPALRRSYAVGDAGTVTLIVRSGTLAVESVAPGAGWSFEVEDQRSDELEITFRSAANEEASFHASVHGGELRVEIEPEDGESLDD